MEKEIKFSEILGNELALIKYVFRQGKVMYKDYLTTDEINLFTYLVEMMLPEEYKINRDMSIYEFCSKYPTLVRSTSNVIIKAKANNEEAITECFNIDAPEIRRCLNDAVTLFNYIMQCQQNLNNIIKKSIYEYTRVRSHEENVKSAKRVLIEAWIINKDGVLNEPYNEEIDYHEITPEELTGSPVFVKK